MMSFRDYLTESVDRRGVTDSQGTPQEDLSKVYVRSGAGSASALDSSLTKMPDADQKKVVGWFATKSNMAEGYVIQTLTPFDEKEFGKDAFRIYHRHGTTIVKFDLKKGKVYFIDNDYYRENDKVKFQSAMAYHRLFIDNNQASFKAFGIV